MSPTTKDWILAVMVTAADYSPGHYPVVTVDGHVVDMDQVAQRIEQEQDRAWKNAALCVARNNACIAAIKAAISEMEE